MNDDNELEKSPEDLEDIQKESLKVSPQTIEPFKKPVYKSIHGEKTKTAFKGARICNECGKPSLMRTQDGSTCLNCGYTE